MGLQNLSKQLCVLTKIVFYLLYTLFYLGGAVKRYVSTPTLVPFYYILELIGTYRSKGLPTPIPYRFICL